MRTPRPRRTVPASGSAAPVSTRSSVDLPQPLRPDDPEPVAGGDGEREVGEQRLAGPAHGHTRSRSTRITGPAGPTPPAPAADSVGTGGPVDSPADDRSTPRPTTGALQDLRRARRQNRLQNIHWIDALYRVYITALLGGDLRDLRRRQAARRQALPGEPRPSWPTRARPRSACSSPSAVAFGLRSGGRGGPLTLEAPVVQHELLAPVPREAVVRGPAIKQIRFMAFAGLVVGGLVGALAGRSLPGQPRRPDRLHRASTVLARRHGLGRAWP